MRPRQNETQKNKQTDRENTQTEVTYTHRKETDRENTPTEKKKHIKTQTEITYTHRKETDRDNTTTEKNTNIKNKNRDNIHSKNRHTAIRHQQKNTYIKNT